MRRYSMGALLFAATACGQATSVSDYERLQAEAAKDAVRAAEAEATAEDPVAGED